MWFVDGGTGCLCKRHFRNDGIASLATNLTGQWDFGLESHSKRLDWIGWLVCAKIIFFHDFSVFFIYFWERTKSIWIKHWTGLITIIIEFLRCFSPPSKLLPSFSFIFESFVARAPLPGGLFAAVHYLGENGDRSDERRLFLRFLSSSCGIQAALQRDSVWTWNTHRLQSHPILTLVPVDEARLYPIFDLGDCCWML